MTDPRLAPLAVAFAEIGEGKVTPARLLAELPPDWCGHEPDIYNGRYTETIMVTARDVANNREIARLRAIEEAARALDESGYLYEIAKLSMDGEECVVALRAALEADHA